MCGPVARRRLLNRGSWLVFFSSRLVYLATLLPFHNISPSVLLKGRVTHQWVYKSRNSAAAKLYISHVSKGFTITASESLLRKPLVFQELFNGGLNWTGRYPNLFSWSGWRRVGVNIYFMGVVSETKEVDGYLNKIAPLSCDVSRATLKHY